MKIETEMREVAGTGKSILMANCPDINGWHSVKNCNPQYCGYIQAWKREGNQIFCSHPNTASISQHPTDEA